MSAPDPSLVEAIGVVEALLRHRGGVGTAAAVAVSRAHAFVRAHHDPAADPKLAALGALARAGDEKLHAAAGELLEGCVLAAGLLEGVADEERRAGKYNAALNVSEVERALAAAIQKARGGA